MPLEKDVFELVVDKLGWRIFVAFDFVAHHFTLFLYLLLRIYAMEDDIGQHVDGFVEMIAMDGTVEHGVFLIGEGIELTSQSIDGIDNLDGTIFLSTFKGEMFAEVRQSLLVGCFIAGARMQGDAAIYYRRLRGQIDNALSKRNIKTIRGHFQSLVL